MPPAAVAPLFTAVTVPAGGTVSVTLPVPDVLTTYVITTTTAAALSDEFTTTTANVTATAAVLLLRGEFPTSVRTGDTVEVAAVVTYTGSDNLPVSVDVTASVAPSEEGGAVGTLGAAAVTVQLTADEPSAVASFLYTAPATPGCAAIDITAAVVAGGAAGVAGATLTSPLDTLPARARVRFGDAIPVEGGGAASATLPLPAAEPGTGTVTVAASAGTLAALHVLAQRLFDTVPAGGFSAPWALTSIGLHAALAQFGAAAYGTPFVVDPNVAAVLGLDASGEVPGCEALAAAFEYTVAAAQELTIGQIIGLSVDSDGAYPTWQPPARADAFLNLAVRSLALAEHLWLPTRAAT